MRRFAAIISLVIMVSMTFLSAIQYAPVDESTSAAYCGDMLTPAHESDSIDRDLSPEGLLQEGFVQVPLAHSPSTDITAELDLQKFLIGHEFDFSTQWLTTYNKLKPPFKFQEIDLPSFDIPS